MFHGALVPFAERRKIIMDYITTVEMSKKWGISSRRISLLCSQGRVPGAEKKGKTWLLPKDAVKPTDPRKKN